MKATLEFTLPDEQEDFDRATRALQFYSALDDIRNELRKRIKYKNFTTEIEHKTYETIYELFFRVIQERNLEEYF